ncbi:MAG TPA: mechanosensitive ion channel [Smithellaceae bacterium]|jgi:small-conductance mechanosensitive channel|nr:mechanosensitive ion channel [Smithellaceae bacterium]HPL67881.1 mechanosensitive ion channel [Smithellaceae bacterium]HQG66707.1 mechanosensitive ion channel [Smithella sp.]
MDKVIHMAKHVIEYLSVPLFSLGSSTFTLWMLVYTIFFLFILVYLAAKINKIIVYQILARRQIDLGIRIAIGSILEYAMLTIGFIIILQTAGIDMSSISILFGALGVGIGFGLQNVTNNFVSGLIILFERPIKVGDRIEMSGVAGDVVNISMRATTIVTNDNISIIVPNSQFISSTVTNWSHMDRNVRFSFPIGVSYREDPPEIEKILTEIALDNPGILTDPQPEVLFTEYGDNALMFSLRVWTSDYINRPGVLKSQLYYAISHRFKEAGIEIPFPQREIYIKEMPKGL